MCRSTPYLKTNTKTKKGIESFVSLNPVTSYITGFSVWDIRRCTPVLRYRSLIKVKRIKDQCTLGLFTYGTVYDIVHYLFLVP